MSMKNSNYTIGNRTRDLPDCSAVPQPAAPLCAPRICDDVLSFHGSDSGGSLCHGVYECTLAIRHIPQLEPDDVPVRTGRQWSLLAPVLACWSQKLRQNACGKRLFCCASPFWPALIAIFVLPSLVDYNKTRNVGIVNLLELEFYI